jgi:hypothetical protein
VSGYPDHLTIERIKKICAEAGVEYVGVQESIPPVPFEVIFNPPAREIWTSLTLPLEELSVAAIYTAIFKAKKNQQEKNP